MFQIKALVASERVLSRRLVLYERNVQLRREERSTRGSQQLSGSKPRVQLSPLPAWGYPFFFLQFLGEEFLTFLLQVKEMVFIYIMKQ